MKRFTLLLALVSVFSIAFGQRVVLDQIDMKGTYVAPETVTDTLVPLGIANASGFTLYTSVGGGFVCGNNGYGDLAKAQQFLVNQGYIIEGVLLWVGEKQVNGTAGTLKVSLNQMNGTATLTTGTGAGPGTELAAKTLTMDMVDTATAFGTFATFMFPSPQIVLQDYCVIFDMALLGDDTIGVVSCIDGDAGQSELSFEKWSDNQWHTLLEAWPLDLDMAIFPVADLSTQGMEDAFINGIRMEQNMPNPVVDVTDIRFELETGANVMFFISDMNGRMVRVVEAGQLEAGQHTLSFDLSDLSAGTYFYAIQAGQNRLARKMQVVR